VPKTAQPDPTPSPLANLEPRRRCILEAAYQVLMERGYSGASTLEIATRARVSKRELYAEFGNKSGILRALIAATAARMQLPLATAEIRDRDDLATVLVSYGTTTLSELTSPHVIAINRLAVAEAGRSSELGEILDDTGREPNRKALIDLMAKAQAAGVLGPGEPEAMAGQFFSLLLGDLTMRLMLGVAHRPGPKEIAKRAQAATRAVLALDAANGSGGAPQRGGRKWTNSNFRPSGSAKNRA
jgi:AcrR family transcriptional regulator